MQRLLSNTCSEEHGWVSMASSRSFLAPSTWEEVGISIAGSGGCGKHDKMRKGAPQGDQPHPVMCGSSALATGLRTCLSRICAELR